MPDPGYPLRCVAEASWRLLGKLLPSSIIDSSGFLDKILSRTSELTEEQGENTSEPWDMDLIEISSSDESEFGTDDDDPEIFDSHSTSATSRKLRLSGASTSSNSSANTIFQGSESFKKAPTRWPLGSNGRPLPGHDSQMKYSLGPRNGAGVGSVHLSTPFVKRDSSSGFVTQINNNGRSYNQPGTSIENGKNFLKDDMHMLDNNGGRILPPTMAHRLSNTSGRYPTSGDLVMPFLSGNNEERFGGPDETIIYQGAVQDLMQPKQERNLPHGLLSVPLLKHQKIALSWMLQKEEKSYCCVGGILADDQGLGKTISTIALIQMQKYLDLKSKSEDKKIHKAEALNLDDDDDNGLVNLDAETKIEKFEGIRDSSQASSSQMASKKQRPAAGTLIVCPASVLRQWERELHDKVDTTAKLSTLVYHGSNRTKDPYELAKYDVVLTTYAIVNNEVPKQPSPDDDEAEPKAGDKYGSSSANRKKKNPSSISNRGKKSKTGTGSCSFGIHDGTLAKVRWLRVVLDEAQTIKNHRTQVAKACCGLRAKKRWCLSGTPIQNAIDELYSYFKFLKFDPYTTYKAFAEAIKAPIAKNPDSGYRKLQVILKNVMLRRTKDTKIDGEPIIRLPPKFIEMRSVNFTEEERGYYFQLESDSRSKFKAYAAAGTVNQNYANILLMLLRLRQACDHPYLVCGFTSGAVKNTASAQMLRQLPKDMLFDLLHRLESSPICQICNDPPEDGVVAMCGHTFCYQCLLDRLEGDDNTCPVSRCKEQLGIDVVFSKPTLESCLSDGSHSSVSNDSEDNQSSGILSDKYCSSKISAAVEILKSLGKASTPVDLDSSLGGNGDTVCLGEKVDANFSVSDVNVRTEIISSQPNQGPAKAIVFSQWTRMLDLVEPALVQSEIAYRRLDGTMSLAARDKAVREFCTDPKVTAMLMSLKAGNLGLNMVAACHVVLLDLWWNPTTEDQAIDRAHRIGQTRPVTVSRLTIKGTVEDRILALQEQKRRLVASAFGEENGGGSASRLTLEDLRYLFMGR